MTLDWWATVIIGTAAGALVVFLGWLLVRDRHADQRFLHLLREFTVVETSPTLEQAVLLALTGRDREDDPPRELYGLALLKAVQAIRPRTSLAGLYLALASLEDKGLITSRWGDESVPELWAAGRQGARRRYYRRVV